VVVHVIDRHITLKFGGCSYNRPTYYTKIDGCSFYRPTYNTKIDGCSCYSPTYYTKIGGCFMLYTDILY
jgi:hypothetical protein